MSPSYFALVAGSVVSVTEGGLLPRTRAMRRATAGDRPPTAYDIPVVTYFGPAFGRRRWFGGHVRLHHPQETHLTEVYLRTRQRALRWLRRAGEGRVW